jgi:hypothetical protein
MVDLQLTPTGTVTDMQQYNVTFPEPTQKTPHTRPDFLDLLVSCPSNYNADAPKRYRSANLGNTIANVKWGGDGNPETIWIGESTFDWGVGRFLIPLDAYPTWQRARGPIGEVVLSVPPVDCPRGWYVKASGRFR